MSWLLLVMTVAASDVITLHRPSRSHQSGGLQMQKSSCRRPPAEKQTDDACLQAPYKHMPGHAFPCMVSHLRNLLEDLEYPRWDHQGGQDDDGYTANQTKTATTMTRMKSRVPTRT